MFVVPMQLGVICCICNKQVLPAVHVACGTKNKSHNFSTHTHAQNIHTHTHTPHTYSLGASIQTVDIM